MAATSRVLSMLERLKSAHHEHPWPTRLFALLSLVAMGLVISLAVDALDLSGRPREAVRPWMTVGIVAHSWDLDPRAVDAHAGLPLPVNGRPFTVQEIADQRGVPVSEIIALVEKTVAEMVEERRKQNQQ
jgi:hypothetical protein